MKHKDVVKVRRVKVGLLCQAHVLSWRARTCKGQAVMFGSVPPHPDPVLSFMVSS